MKATKEKQNPIVAAIKKNNYYLILVAALVAIFIIVTFINSNFATLGNVVSMMEQMSEYALMALGIMLCFVAGGVDLSTVGVANLVAALAAMSLLRFVPEGCSDGTYALGMVLIIVGGIAIGIVAGLINGFLIAKLGIPPMLATMAANYVYTGICMVLTEGASISGINTRYVDALSYKFFGVLPISIVILLICTALIGVLMNKATFGTKLCMVGTNPKATRMAGLNNDRILITVHVICSALSALAGLIMLSRLSSSRADYGKAYSTQAILIVILGGTDPLGGSGKVLGVLLGSFIIQAVTTAISMIPGANSYIKNVVFASLLLGLMILDWYRAKGKKRK